MRRDPTAVLFSFLCLFATALLPAQGTREQLLSDITKAFEATDTKAIDQAIKKAPGHTVRLFEDWCFDKLRNHPEVQTKLDALKESWARCFDKSPTLEKVQRWVDSHSNADFDELQRARTSTARNWEAYSVVKDPPREDRIRFMHDFVTQAQNVSQKLGHSIEVADNYNLASVIGASIPGKSIEERKEVVEITQQFLSAREDWGFTGDTYYPQSAAWVKAEKARIAEDIKKGDKRKSEGYDPESKGIDSLVMPGAKAEMHAYTYEGLQAWDTELDYGPKNGMLPVMWWNMPLTKDKPVKKFDWFRRRNLFLVRMGANKFGVSLTEDGKNPVEVDCSGKPKPSLFWLDPDKKQPYTMFFWAGSDKERVGDVESNLMFTTDFANVYYRSGASWKTTIGTETLVFYDDNCNGDPCDGEIFDPPLKVATCGDYGGDGTLVPLLDSMRVGKGPRVPYSEFVKLSTGWVHMRRDKETVGVRPLNPEYFKTGKIKLTWNGPKPAAPVQLVVQGSGDFHTAMFDVAGGKEVEVPATNYTVVFGRIAVGKGARAQQATIYQGTSVAFTVEAGKTYDLKMGAPFSMHFERRGDDEVTIDALKIMLHDVSGCLITELFGLALAPEVLAAKTEDGKGARVVGKFGHFTDGELTRVAGDKFNKLGVLVALFPMPDGYKSGDLNVKFKSPGPGWKVGLSMKKHPLFGVIGSPWE